MRPMRAIPRPQPHGVSALHPLRQQTVHAPFHLRHPARIARGTQLLSAFPEMNRFSKEGLQSDGPPQPGLVVPQPLEIPQLVSQTHLATLGRSFEFGTQAVADPAL